MNARMLPYCTMLLGLLLLGACTPPGGGREKVGELGVAGPNVFVNGQAASAGTTLYSGDTVTTGAGSSAMVLLVTGGVFQVDENTDPIFSWATFASVRCILVRIIRGQGYVEDRQACVSSPAADALAHSAVNIVASSSTSVLTLLEGTLLLQRPQQLSLAPGQEVTANLNAARVQVRNLSPAELQSRVAWRLRFRFQGWCGVQPAWLGACPGQFSFSRPTPPPSVLPPPILPFPGYVAPRPSIPPGKLPPR